MNAYISEKEKKCTFTYIVNKDENDFRGRIDEYLNSSTLCQSREYMVEETKNRTKTLSLVTNESPTFIIIYTTIVFDLSLDTKFEFNIRCLFSILHN